MRFRSGWPKRFPMLVPAIEGLGYSAAAQSLGSPGDALLDWQYAEPAGRRRVSVSGGSFSRSGSSVSKHMAKSFPESIKVLRGPLTTGVPATVLQRSG